MPHGLLWQVDHTGGILETTLDPLDLGFDPVNGLTVNQTGYGFEVAVAAAGEGYVADHISVNVKIGSLRAGSACLIYIVHCNISFI